MDLVKHAVGGFPPRGKMDQRIRRSMLKDWIACVESGRAKEFGLPEERLEDWKAELKNLEEK